MNLALTNYVLVDEHNRPVPLPFHTRQDDMPVIVYNFDEPRHANSSGRIHTSNGCYFPHVFNLRIISENEYMARQAGCEPLLLMCATNGVEIPLPHYLPDDQTVTRVDAEFLVCETTQSITWLDPAKYGLHIVAYCDKVHNSHPENV